MKEEIKAPLVPEQTPETPVHEPLIDNRRAEIEKLVIASNEFIPEPEKDPDADPVPETPEKPKGLEDSEEDALSRIKNSMQKRINKLSAKQKTAEERLAEIEVENAKLRAELAKPKVPEPVQDSKPVKEDELTSAQIEAWLIKTAEEGTLTKSDEVRANILLTKALKREAVKEFQAEQDKQKTEESEKTNKVNSDLQDLARDYVVYDDNGQPDPSADLNLANQQGTLFKTAMSLYNDKELHAALYNDANVVRGFRRAVSDAYQSLLHQNLTPKVSERVPEKRTQKASLADPGADYSDSPSQSNASQNLSDAEKAREEIRQRTKNRYLRRPAPN